MPSTPATTNLLIINLLLFAASYVFPTGLGIDLNALLGLHYISASDFGPWQFVTFMFMHAGLTHIIFNMFALWMFGRLIESALGSQRFIFYYLVCGLGSGIIQQIAYFCNINPIIEAVNTLLGDMSTESIQTFLNRHVVAFSVDSQQLIAEFIKNYNNLVHTDTTQAMAVARTFAENYQAAYINSQLTVGASGAVFGILLAVGMLFPNMRLMIFPLPIPIKAKWVVMGYGVIELFEGVSNFQLDNVAHWAHLGGMLFGFILLRAWRVERFN